MHTRVVHSLHPSVTIFTSFLIEKMACKESTVFNVQAKDSALNAQYQFSLPFCQGQADHSTLSTKELIRVTARNKGGISCSLALF